MYDELVRDLRKVSLSYGDKKDLYGCAADAIEELQGKLYLMKKTAEWLGEKIPRWISVEERLPEDGVFVLVCNDDGHMMIAKHKSEVYEWYYKYTNYDFDIWDNEEQGPVCYWMPLPPKEET